jgi:hypothetical protein
MPAESQELTLDEVLEQMLPLLDGDPFEVAKWVDDHIQKKEGVRLLADGVVVAPHLCATELAVVTKIASNGTPSLEVVPRGRAFGHTKIVGTVIVGRDKDRKPIERPREETRPIEWWTVERKSFEVNRSNTKRSGRPLTKREWVLIEAATYIVEKGLPDPPTADALYTELAVIHGAQCPSRGLAMEVLPSLVRRIKDALSG